VVVGVEPAQIALRLAVEFDRDLRHATSALVIEGALERSVLGADGDRPVERRHDPF
jgi:hypothetical protein